MGVLFGRFCQILKSISRPIDASRESQPRVLQAEPYRSMINDGRRSFGSLSIRGSNGGKTMLSRPPYCVAINVEILWNQDGAGFVLSSSW